jgi:hypothetical protein
MPTDDELARIFTSNPGRPASWFLATYGWEVHVQTVHHHLQRWRQREVSGSIEGAASLSKEEFSAAMKTSQDERLRMGR